MAYLEVNLHIDMDEIPDDVPRPPSSWVIEAAIAPAIIEYIKEDNRKERIKRLARV